MFIINLYTKFHIPHSNGPITYHCQTESQQKFCMFAILLFYILEANIWNFPFFEYPTPYITSGHFTACRYRRLHLVIFCIRHALINDRRKWKNIALWLTHHTQLSHESSWKLVHWLKRKKEGNVNRTVIRKPAFLLQTEGTLKLNTLWSKWFVTTVTKRKHSLTKPPCYVPRSIVTQY
jgi:hypothetical protein